MSKSGYTPYLFFIVYSISGCASRDESVAGTPADTPGMSTYLYVWAGDEDEREGDTDFLAVLDANPSSPGYGDLLNTAPVGAVGTNPHHAEPVAPDGALLFANGFDSGRTFLFDLSRPSAPEMVRELDPVEGYRSPHSFLRLDNGELLATFQHGDGSLPGDPGGLARFDREGQLIDVQSAADAAFAGEVIRPYSVEVLPSLNRVVTTGRTMDTRLERSADVVQIWSLSDLTLLKTLPVPPIPPAAQPTCILGVGDRCSAEHYAGERQPFEARAMSDGSVLMNTVSCGIYRISGLEGDSPEIETAFDWPDMLGCSVPAVIGDYYILPVIFAETIVVIDVSDPENPREASRFATPGYTPHWAAADPLASRIAVTSTGPDKVLTVLMLDFDQDTGTLTLDESFGEPDFPRAGVSFYREDWPHGSTGFAIPHAALFGH